jgi:hypothetical protein
MSAHSIAIKVVSEPIFSVVVQIDFVSISEYSSESHNYRVNIKTT